jgi:hypothetical protein
MVGVFKWTKVWLAVSLVVPGFFLIGCGQGGPPVVPVSGQVLIDGEPLATGIPGFIQVVPSNGRPATGTIDPQTGRFSLSTVEPGDGCIQGTHKVLVIMQQMVGQESESLVPVRYTELEMTDLSATIDGPTDSLTIELTGPLKPVRSDATTTEEDDPFKY